MAKPTEFGADLTLTNVKTDDECEFIVKGTVAPGHPGRLTGPPEDCYPAEGPEVEISQLLRFDRRDETGHDHYVEVPESEWEQWGADREMLEERLIEHANAYWEGAKEDADEARAERQRERLYEDPSDGADDE